MKFHPFSLLEKCFWLTLEKSTIGLCLEKILTTPMDIPAIGDNSLWHIYMAAGARN